MKYYFFWKHQFGQWTLRDITSPDGITFNCCEQYMMFHKAILFKDEITAQKILDEKDPHFHKKLGREVANYDEEIWKQYRLGIVWHGNYLKFTQHDDLRERLINTENDILVEASPYDKIWGIGLSADDPLAQNQNTWRGLNLLGKCITSVRDFIK